MSMFHARLFSFIVSAGTVKGQEMLDGMRC